MSGNSGSDIFFMYIVTFSPLRSLHSYRSEPPAVDGVGGHGGVLRVGGLLLSAAQTVS